MTQRLYQNCAMNLSDDKAFYAAYENELTHLRAVVQDKTDEIINKLNNLSSVDVCVLEHTARALQQMQLAVREMEAEVEERLNLRKELHWLQYKIVGSDFSSFPLTDMGHRIGSLHSSLCQYVRLSVPVIELKWNIKKVGRISVEYCELDLIYNPYALCTDPVWNNTSVGMHVPSSEGVAVDELTGNIYVAGYQDQGIKVFNQTGGYLTSFTSQLLKYTYDVCCTRKYVYVTTVRDIVKVDKTSGTVLASRHLGFESGGTAVDPRGYVYVCHCTNLRISVFDPNLNNCKSLTLRSPHFSPGRTLIQCLRLKSEEIYILFENSSYPIQCFSYRGKLKRCVVLESQIENASDFCLDSHSNILVNELSGKQIKVFSRNGNLLQLIHKAGCKQRGRTNVVTRGLAVTQNNRIVTSLSRATNCIQVY